MCGNAPASAFARKPGGGELRPGKARANRSTSFRRLSRVLLPPRTGKKCSATHEAREKGEPACAAEGSVYEPPAAPHCREARERWVERREINGWEKWKYSTLPAVKIRAVIWRETNASASRERVPPSAEYGRPGEVGWRGEAASSGPARDGCHCFVTAERGCDGDQLGSLRTPPPISGVNAPLPLPRSRPGGAGRSMVGGGGFAAEGALRLPIRASGAAGSKSHRLF